MCVCAVCVCVMTGDVEEESYEICLHTFFMNETTLLGNMSGSSKWLFQERTSVIYRHVIL